MYLAPENWPFFKSERNDHTAQCLAHGNTFLRFYVNDYNCNKSCLGTCFSRLIPRLHSNSVSSPETLPWTRSPWLILCQSYLRMYALGKGLVELLQPWSILFIYSQQLVEKYIRPLLKLVRQVPFLSPSDVYIRNFLYPVTLNKILHTKLWVTESLFLVLELNLLQRPWIWRHCSPFTVSYQDFPGKNTGGVAISYCHFLLFLASLESLKKLLLYFSDL